jgi:hypothetical protein
MGCCGVYVGISACDYLLDHVKPMATELNAFILPGNVLSVAAGRLSFIFGLKGPSMAVDTVWRRAINPIPETNLKRKARYPNQEWKSKAPTFGDPNPLICPLFYVMTR